MGSWQETKVKPVKYKSISSQKCNHHLEIVDPPLGLDISSQTMFTNIFVGVQCMPFLNVSKLNLLLYFGLLKHLINICDSQLGVSHQLK